MKTPKRDLTGANRENGEKNLCSLRFLLLNSPGKPELREYKAVFVVGDVEVSQFSDEITVNCAPLV